MSLLSRTTVVLAALNVATTLAASSTSTGYIALYSNGLQIPVNVNPSYETVQGSSTKWIGKNTQWLTDEIVTSTTSGGTTTTSTKEIGIGASTTTASASGSGVPAIGFTISPDAVSKLESAAASACGGGSRKRQAACSLSADALAAHLESIVAGSLSAADVAALQQGVGAAAAFSAASLLIASTYLASKSIPMNLGVNLPSLKAAASKAASSTTSSSSSSRTAVTITNSIDAMQPIDTDTAALAAQGSYIISSALASSDAYFDGTGQTFTCNNFADPHNSMTMPNDYCVCQDGKSYPVTSGPTPCPYTAAPKSTVVFTTSSSSSPSPTPTPSSTSTTASGIQLGHATCADPAAPTFARDAASSAISVVCASAVQSAWSYSPSASSVSNNDIANNRLYQGSLSQKFSDVTNGNQELAISLNAMQQACGSNEAFSIDFKAMGQDRCVNDWMAAVDGCDTNTLDKHGGIVYQDCLLWQVGMVQQ